MVARARLGAACAVAFAVLLGLGFAIGTFAGFAWSSRSKVCAEVPHPTGATVVVCDYDYHPPTGWEIR